MRQATKSQTHRNRGMHLERLLIMTNAQYRAKSIADVRKIPTPVLITRKLAGGAVTGRLQKGEWVDYAGVWQGKSLLFDAKMTEETTRFPLQNVGDNQFEILKSWHELGAITFLLVMFVRRELETYLVPFPMLEEAWSGYKGDGPKSIPYTKIKERCKQVTSKDGYVLHYLEHLGEETGNEHS